MFRHCGWNPGHGTNEILTFSSDDILAEKYELEDLNCLLIVKLLNL
jgi:hypothetical protein